MTVYAYIRVSKDEQAQLGHSLSAQITKIQAYCTFKELDPPLIIEDAGVSSKIHLYDRPGGAKLLTLMRPGDHIVVAKLDRAWRRAVEALTTAEDLRDHGVTLHLLDCAVDTDSPHGKMFFTIIAAMAEWERALLSERTKLGLAQARHEGKWLGNPPLGWRRTSSGLELDPKGLVLGAALIALHDLKIPDGDRILSLMKWGWPRTPARRHAWTSASIWSLTRRLLKNRPAVYAALTKLDLMVKVQLSPDPTLWVTTRDGSPSETISSPFWLPPQPPPRNAPGGL